jgi:hypothetical protein
VTDIVAFLVARLDEDERIARAATDGPWTADSGSSRSIVGATGPLPRLAGHVVCSVGAYDRGVPSTADVEHILRHDPARVLREVAAKRRRLERYSTSLVALAAAEGTLLAGATKISLRARREAVLDDAAVYSGHPDFAPGWRIDA